MILNMNQLRAFYTAARAGSVAGAAHELMVTPPAVSMQIKQLEETLGIRLLFRAGNGIRLTPAGETVFARARQIFERIHEMEGFLEDMSTGRSGELRIGSPQTPAQHIMPRLIAAFKKTYPGIRIIVEQGTNAEMLASLAQRRTELALIRHVPGKDRLKVKHIGTETLILIAAPASLHLPGAEVAAGQLARAPFILPGKGSAMRAVVREYFQRFKLEPNVIMESSSTALIKGLVRADEGVALVEGYAVRAEIAQGIFKEVRILEGSPAIAFGIGYLNRRDLTPAAWAFLRLLDTSENLLPFGR